MGWSVGGAGDVGSTAAGARQAEVSTAKVDVKNDDVRANLVEKKVTCPFLGAGVASQKLPVLNDVNRPLANVADVAALGNTGKGSDLGEVLKLFARGNHQKLPSANGQFDTQVPEGTFSLDLPGSQGSHPGHSGILEGDPKKLGTGAFNAAAWETLMKRADSNGMIRRSDVGKFIAANVAKDPTSQVGLEALGKTLKDLKGLAGVEHDSLLTKLGLKSGASAEEKAAAYQKLTKALGENNLTGSAGEYGLMFAFLANSPKSHKVGGEPAISVADLKAMFVDKQFPPGWDQWKKTAHDWVDNSAGLSVAAAEEYLKLKTPGWKNP